VVSGWNEYVNDKHEAARQAYLDWVFLNKPRQGPSFVLMKQSRAQFKLAPRYCKQHEDMMRADAAAASLACKDYRKFWSSIQKSSGTRASKFVNIVDGCTGDTAIVDRWHRHFEQLYNSCDFESQNQFYMRLEHMQSISDNVIISVQDVKEACCKQKRNKSPGLDGIHMEAVIHGSNRLYVHLSLLFNMFIKFSFLPSSFMASVIVPLIKDKCGDETDVNNYRAIAISCAFSKIFESLIASYIQSVNVVHKYQFGFKPRHSTSLCTSILKQTSRGSHVFMCFVDFKKAFD